MQKAKLVKHVAAAVMGASLMFGGVAAGVGSITPIASAQEAVTSTYYVDVTALNVRSTPSLTGTIVSSLSYGAVVSLVGDPVTADGYVWYHVQQAGNLLGWSVNGFTLGTAPTDGGTTPTNPTTPPTPSTGDFLYGDPVMVNTDLLNVRSLPSISASVLTVYSYGTSATVTGEARVADGITWYPVDNFGWVAGQYLWLNACGCRNGSGPTGGDSTTPTPSGSFFFGESVTVNTDFLNVRQSPSLSGAIVDVYEYGTIVRTGGSAIVADGITWYPVDAYHWVAGQYLIQTPDGPLDTANATYEVYSYGDSVGLVGLGAFVLSSPSLDASIVSYDGGLTITGDATVVDGRVWYPVDNIGWVIDTDVALPYR